MRYSDEIIEEVRSRNGIVDVISEYVKLKRKGAYYFGVCPFHTEKTGSFSVTPGREMYHCFGCNESGNVFTFLMKYNNMTFQESVKALADRAGMKLPEPETDSRSRAEADKRAVLLEINKQAAGFYYKKLRSNAGKTALTYLEGRKLSYDTMQKFGLGYADRYSNELYRFLKPKGYTDQQLVDSGLFIADEKRGMQDKFWNRVMFPIMDANSHVIAFGGRVMGDGKPKYLNSPETRIFEKSRNLYGLHIARRTRQKYMLLCEGYMDVIAMHQAGFDNAIASLGTALTPGQITLLKRFTDEVLMLYDSDEAGIRAALRGIPMLREAGISTKVVNLHPYKDPDEFIKGEGKEAFSQRLQKAENGFMYEIRMLERSYDLQDPEGKTSFFKQVCLYLMRFEEELERNTYLDAVARRYHVKSDELKEMLRNRARGGKVVREVQKLQSQDDKPAKRPQKQSGFDKTQRWLLAWLVQYPEIWDEVKKYIDSDDFSDPFYAKLFELLLPQLENRQVNAASLINCFEDSDQQSRAAGVFQDAREVEGTEDKQQVLLDLVCNLRTQSYSRRIKTSEASEFPKLMEERKKTELLQKNGLSGRYFGNK